MTERPSPPLVDELAASCVEYVRRVVGVDLDFTSDTLPLLDHYLAQAKASARERPQALELIARVASAYFGEVLRRRFDCWWFQEGDDVAGWVLRFGPVYLEVSPYAMAAEAAGQRLPEGLDASFSLDPGDIEFIGAHLAALPEVSEEDFVRLSTRYDTLEVVVEQLKARAQARNLGDVFFEDPDYEDA